MFYLQHDDSYLLRYKFDFSEELKKNYLLAKDGKTSIYKKSIKKHSLSNPVILIFWEMIMMFWKDSKCSTYWLYRLKMSKRRLRKMSKRTLSNRITFNCLDMNVIFWKDSNRNTYSLFKMKKRRSRKYRQVYHFKHNYSISIDKKVRYHRIFQLRDSKVDVSYLV